MHLKTGTYTYGSNRNESESQPAVRSVAINCCKATCHVTRGDGSGTHNATITRDIMGPTWEFLSEGYCARRSVKLTHFRNGLYLGQCCSVSESFARRLPGRRPSMPHPDRSFNGHETQCNQCNRDQNSVHGDGSPIPHKNIHKPRTSIPNIGIHVVFRPHAVHESNIPRHPTSPNHSKI